MPTTSNFPGMDEVLKFLQEQAAKDAQPKVIPGSGGLGQPTIPERVVLPPARTFPTTGPTTMGGTPIPQTFGKGVFAESLGGAGSVLRGLGGLASRAAGPVMAGVALAPVAKNVGQSIGSAIGDDLYPEQARLAKERAGSFVGQNRLPTLEELGYPTEKQVLPTRAPQTVEEYIDSQYPVAPTQTPAQPIPSKQAPAGPVEPTRADLHDLDQEEAAQVAPMFARNEVEEVGETQPDNETNEGGAKDEADSFMKQVLATLEPQAPIQESPDTESTKAISELTQPKKVEQKPETLGRKIKRFITAGSGPIDFTRMDQQELALERARQQFTPQEALRGELAKNDIEGSRKFNRDVMLEREKSGGLTERGKFSALLSSNERERQLGREAKKEEIGLEHKNKMEELGAMAATQKLTPEAQKTQMQHDLLKSYMYAFTPEEIKKFTGLDVSQAGLEAVKAAAQKDNPMAIAVAQLLQQRMQTQATQQQKGKQNLTLNSLAGKK